MTQHDESHESTTPATFPALVAAIHQAATQATSLDTFLHNWLQIIGATWPAVTAASAYIYDGADLRPSAQYGSATDHTAAHSPAAQAAVTQSVIVPDGTGPLVTWGLPLIQNTTSIGAYQVTLPAETETTPTIGSTLADLQSVIALAITRFHASEADTNIKPLLTILNQIARQLSISTDSIGTFHTICRNLTLMPGMIYAALIGLEVTTTTQFVLSEHPVMINLPARQSLGANTLISHAQKNPMPMVLNTQETIAELLGDHYAAVNTLPLQALLVIPLRVQNEYVGTLLLASDQPEIVLIQSETYIMEAIATQIALSLRNTMLNRSIQVRANQLEQATVFGRMVTSTFDEIEIMRYVADIVPRLLDCDHVNIVLYTPGHPQMDMYDLRVDRSPSATPLSAGGSSVEEVVNSYTPITLSDLKRSTYTDHKRLAHSGLAAMLTVPLLASKKPLGTLSIAHHLPDMYTHTDLTLLQQIGTQIAIALENALLYQSAQQRAIYEEALSGITSRLQQQSDLRVMLEQTMRDLGATLGARRARVRLQLGPHDDSIKPEE